MPTTVGRSRGRQGVHSGAQGATGDHMRKIMATLITAIVVLVAVLVLTSAGREIDAATQRFMLYYAGVLALVGLTGSVLLGLLATDRIVMTPGHRVMAQAVHRAFSFGTLAFLVIHIVTEILAQRSHVIDAVVPFLSPYRTFYIGLGTIASDLIVLLVVTSIVRKRFTEHAMYSWSTATGSGIVEARHVVVHERSAVQQLNRDRSTISNGRFIVAASSCNSQTDPRTNPRAGRKNRRAHSGREARRTRWGIDARNR